MSLINDAVTARAAATFFDRIADRLEARAVLASAWSVTLGRSGGGSCFQPVSQAWTATMPSDGKAQLDLGDGYTLEFDEANSQILIHNANTGETTNIWGDPHIDWNGDGRTDADFWGTTTFQLDNGVKVTIDTEPWGDDPSTYVASKVTITRGENAVVVDGISQNRLGDLSITQSSNGQLVDLLTDDGFTVLENPFGEGWLNGDTGLPATQADFDVTRPGASAREFDAGFASAIASFLMLGFIAGVFESLDSDAGDTGNQAARSTLNVFRPDL